ncbi:RNA polymerase sigma factor [Pseudomonas pergaminensis]|uniref:RNA polymerase sigma factor n=1 Tax=Pseudomonas pergaminensis TaxID=2853159 RepID=A0ABD7TP39_9PSED|nr:MULTISPECIES: RNA polymerase sigma factor [Pseudomonas]MBT1262144.1 RNA polymerase sigma factor [Pseudomonas sp. VS40]MBT1274059.1 RNA polymerase sigma factor [Pseudomonas sp. VS59]PIB42832.1 RNA polymerase subunit sigma [Pseudomonas sp. 2588-5]USW03412.1 RNA polymerase sigma factor [Pseudomonas pergaminensis]
MKDTDPDVELLARISNNEPAAVNEMVTRKLPRLLALASRILGDADEAKDVAQESFLRIWRHAASWRSGEARFDTWLHRVALNLCHDRLRRRKERPLSDDDTAALVDTTPSLDEQLEAADRSARMAAALAALPERQREAIVLQYYQELSNIDAAALMNISVEALESLLSRARRQLRSQLADTPGLARPGRGTS